MQNKSTTVILVLMLGLGLSGVAQADCKDMSASEREEKMNKFSQELKLTTDQKNQIRDIKNDKFRKITESKTDAQGKIRKVLTPEQQAKYDKMLADKND